MLQSCENFSQALSKSFDYSQSYGADSDQT